MICPTCQEEKPEAAFDRNPLTGTPRQDCRCREAWRQLGERRQQVEEDAKRRW